MARPSGQSLRFTRLVLTSWRNFREVDVTLGRRALIVGPNASGKSNFLDAIRFLGELARPGAGGLQAAVASRSGFSALRCLHARRKPYVEIDAHIGTDDAPSTWRYKLQINVVKNEKRPTIVEEGIWHNDAVIKERQRSDTDDPFIYAQSLMEQAQTSVEFRELSEFLGSCRYLHVVPQIVRDRTRHRNDGEDPYGGDLLRRMKAMPLKTRVPRLKRISEALRLAVPQFEDITLEDDADGVPHLKAAYRNWRPYTYKQSEEMFSDGTLRLIGLLWSISERGGPLLLEEPELSLNDSVVGELPRMFARMQRLSGRQVIATTHSPALLDDPDIGLREVHWIAVDSNGSHIHTLAGNPAVAAQVEAGMTISEAVLPLLRPQGIERLGELDVVG